MRALLGLALRFWRRRASLWRLHGIARFTRPMKSDDEQCAICLADLDSEHTTSLSGCGHAFHSDCIVRALQHNRACPLCRYKPAPVDESTGNNEATTTLAEDQQRMLQRNRAIRSALMRVRHGSASATTQTAAQEYRSLADSIRDTRSLLRTLDRTVRTQRRAYTIDLTKVVRHHRQTARPVARRWWACQTRLADLERERRQLGDVLAQEAGFR